MGRKNVQKKVLREARKMGMKPDDLKSQRDKIRRRKAADAEKAVRSAADSANADPRSKRSAASTPSLSKRISAAAQDRKRKRAVESMSADDFLSGGFLDDEGDDNEEEEEDDDDEEEEEDTASADDSGDDASDEEGKGEKKTMKKKSHADELAALKEKDPEFYKFLAENDKGLLDFGGEEDDDDDEEEDDDEEDDEDDEADDDDADRNKGKKAKKSGKADGGDDSDGDDDGTSGKGANKVLRAAAFRAWQSSAAKAMKDSGGRVPLSLVRKFARAFRSGVRHGDGEEPLDGDFVIPDQEVFHMVMVWCTKSMGALFDATTGFKRRAAESRPGNAGRGVRLPDRSSVEWKATKPVVKSFLSNLVHFMRGVTDPGLTAFIARHTSATLCPYLAMFPNTATRYLKVLLGWWAASRETSTRAHAFLAVRALAIDMPFPFIETCMRSMYLTFARNAKFGGVETADHMTFLTNSVVELFMLDAPAAYQQAFGFVRQLAIHLRAALSSRTKDAYQNVYNWQFIHCLRVWVRLMCECARKNAETAAGGDGAAGSAAAGASYGDVTQLVYPLAQVIHGVITLVPTARFFPLRFQCVQMLNDLAKGLGMYIPVSQHLTEVLTCGDLGKKPAAGSTKVLDLSHQIRSAKSVVASPSYHDAAVNEACRLLLGSLANSACTLSFPEVAIPVLAALRRAVKSIRVARFRRTVHAVVDKIRQQQEWVLRKRGRADFAPRDTAEAEAFNKALAAETPKPPLIQFHETQERLAALRRGAAVTGAPVPTESGQDEPRGKRARTGAGAEDDESEDSSSDDDDDEDDESDGKVAKGKGKGKKKSTPEAWGSAIESAGPALDIPDEITAFELSSSEEEDVVDDDEANDDDDEEDSNPYEGSIADDDEDSSTDGEGMGFMEFDGDDA